MPTRLARQAYGSRVMVGWRGREERFINEISNRQVRDAKKEKANKTPHNKQMQSGSNNS